jgi:hypothetical protein
VAGNAPDREPRRLVYAVCIAFGLALTPYPGTMRALAQDVTDPARGARQPAPWPDLWQEDRDARELRALTVAQSSGGASTEGVEQSGSAEAAPPSAMTWRLPPIRFGGTLTTDLRYLDVSNQRSLQLVETSSFRLGSYIWQPWFALVNGSVDLLTTQDRELDHTAGPRADRVKSSSIGGTGSLSVFPSSRFPFNGYFERSDSRTSGEPTLNSYTTTRFGGRQAYQPLDGRSSYSAHYDRSVIESAAFGRDVVNSMGASFSRQFELQNLNVIGQRTTNDRQRGDGSALNRITATHSYRPDPTVAVETLGNVSSDEFRLTSGPAPVSSLSRFAQLNTFATWRPDPEEWPVYVTGGARYFQSMVETNGVPSEATAVSANLAANYRFRPDLNFFVSGSVSHAVDELLTTQTVGGTYTPTPLALGKYLYSWNANLALNNQTAGSTGAQQSVSGQVGHTISRPYALSDTTHLSVSGGQSFSSTADTVGAATYTMSHTANAALRFTPTPNSNAFVSVLAADARSSGTNESTFQLVNVQVSGQLQFNRYSIATANFTLQGSRQATDSTPDAGFTFNTSGSLTYQHARAFGVARLRYYAAYNAYDTRFRNRLQGDIDAPRDQISQSFDQRLDYNIGRVELRLAARFAVIEGQRTGLVFFRMVRQFGAF